MSESPKLLFAGRFSETLSSRKKSPARISRRFCSEAGYSMAEVVVVICVIGILAAVGIPAIVGGVTSSKKTTASSNLENLNAAVRKYGTAVVELANEPTSGTDEEVAIITQLMIRGTEQSRPGSPYLGENTKVTLSSDVSDYRASWNKYEFILIEPGTTGEGLDLLKMQ